MRLLVHNTSGHDDVLSGKGAAVVVRGVHARMREEVEKG